MFEDFTLFILPGRNGFSPLCLTTWGKLPLRVVPIDKNNFHRYPVYTAWFGYIYTDEYIDENIFAALPSYFASNEYDFYLMWKKTRHPEDKQVIPLQSPRIFRTGLQLDQNLVPLNPEKLRYTTILDGWIESALV